MIVVAGHLTIKPESLDAALEAIRTCVAATRAEEGNIDYRYSTDIDDPTRLNLVEIWEDEEAMTAHMGTEHLATFLGAVGDFVGGSVEIVRYDVSGTSKLF